MAGSKEKEENPIISTLKVVNETTGRWLVGPLPANLSIHNGSSTTAINIINGQIYNGPRIANLTAISRRPSVTVGSMPTRSAIYLIMSLLFLIPLGYRLFLWIKDVTEPFTPTQEGRISDHEFSRTLKEIYPRIGEELWPPSYAEVLDPTSAKISSETIRHGRSLIRQKYALDVQIFSLRNVVAIDRPRVQIMMDKSDALLTHIRAMVQTWIDVGRHNWSEDEWRKIGQIREKIQSSEIKTWGDNPLWR